MTKHTKGFAKTHTIVEVNAFVSQNENILVGPLVAMGNDGTQSTFTFDVGAGKPSKFVVVTPWKSGKANPPANSKVVVADATIFVSGTLTQCSADRPN